MRLKIFAIIFLICMMQIFAMEDDGYTPEERQMLNEYVSGTHSAGGRNRQSRSRSMAGGGSRSGHPHDTGHRHRDYRQQQDDYTDDEVDDVSRHPGNNPPPPYPGSPDHHGHQDDWDHHHQQQEYGVVNPQQGSAAEFGMSEAEYQEFLKRTREEAHQSRRNNQQPREALTEQQQLDDVLSQSKLEYEQLQEFQEQMALAASKHEAQPKTDPASLTGAESEALIRLIDSNGDEDQIAELSPESQRKVLKAWTELIRQSAKKDHQEMALTEVEDWLLQELLNTGDLSVLDVLEGNWASRNRVEKAWTALRGPTADGASSSSGHAQQRRGATDNESEWERNSRVAQRRPQHGGGSGGYVEPGDSEWEHNSRIGQQTQRDSRRLDAGRDSEWDSNASRVPQRTRSRNARNEDEERFVQQRGQGQYEEAHSYTDWKYNSRGAQQQHSRVAEPDSETDSNYLRRQAGEAAQRRWRQAEETRRQRGDITESDWDRGVEVPEQRMRLVNPGSQRNDQETVRQRGDFAESDWDTNAEVAQQRMRLVNPPTQRNEGIAEKRARAAEAAQQRARAAAEAERARLTESDSDNNSEVAQPEEPGSQIAVPNSLRSQNKRIAELAKLEAGMQAFEQLHSRERMFGSKHDSPRQPHTFKTPGKKINPHQIDDEEEGEEHVEHLVRRKSNRKMEMPNHPAEVVPDQSALSSNSPTNDHQTKDTDGEETEEGEEESGSDQPEDLEQQVEPQHTSSTNHQQGPIDLHTTDTESDDDQIAHQAPTKNQKLADQTPTEEQKLQHQQPTHSTDYLQKQKKPMEPFSSDSDSEDEKARALRDQKLAAQAPKLLKKPQIEEFYENTDMEDVRQHHTAMSRSENRSGSGRLGGGGSSESSAKSPAKLKAKNAKSPGDLTAGNRSFLKGSDQTAGRSARDHRSTADVGHGGSASLRSIGGSGRTSFDNRSLGGDQTDASRRNVQQVRGHPDPEALVQANRRSLARDQHPAADRTSGSGRMRADQHRLEEQGRNPGGQPSLNRTGSQRYNDPAKFQANLTKLQRTTGSSGRRSIDQVSFADQRSAIGGGGGGRPSVDQGRNSFYLDANAELELDESEHEPEEHAQSKGRTFGKGWSKLVGSSSSSKSNTAKSLLNKLNMFNLDGKKNKNQE